MILFDPILTETDVVERYLIFAIIPTFWALVLFLINALPWGRKDV